MLLLGLAFAGLAAGQSSTRATSTATASGAAPTASGTPSGVTVIVEPTSYDASLGSFVFATRTSTTATQPAAQATDLPSSLYCNTASYGNATGPFCLPNNGTQQIKDKQYSVTWDSSFASNCAEVTIALIYYGSTSGQLVTQFTSSNVVGFANYTVQGGWLEKASTQNVQFVIVPYQCTGSQPSQQAGPIIQLRDKVETIVVKPTSRDRVLGLSIGLPLALLATLGVVFGVFWWNRSHRTIPKFAGRNKGYTGRRARGVKLQDMAPGSDGNAGRYTDDPEGYRDDDR